jgi:uncharacterized repeat protein (TIGR03803 family)
LIRSSSAVRIFAVSLCAGLTGCYLGGSTTAIPFGARTSALLANREQSGTVIYESIYSFGRKANDGAEPFANLTVVGDELYGTTEIGGATTQFCFLGCGTVFRVTTSGAEQVTYRFKGGADGANPAAGLVLFDGRLFGTTSGGGDEKSGCSGGCGTVFELSADGKSERILHAFAGGADGANPVAGLVALNRRLYGTTQYGGKRERLCATGCGTIFSIAPDGKEQVIYRFSGGADGAFPAARLITIAGALYGTTEFGGTITALCSQGCGTVFRAGAGGAKKTLHAFKDSAASPDGAYPAAEVVAMGGKLYGTTLGGGKRGDGTVYAVNESTHFERIIHNFSCCGSSSDGQYPLAHLSVLRGTLYGTTHLGGAKNLGTLFSVTPSGEERVLYSFLGKPDGEEPQAGLALLNGTFYGTTSLGGAFSEGSIFKLTP